MSTSEIKEAAWKEYYDASKALKGFPRLPNGLTTDAAKATPEWKAAKARYEKAFATLRKLNSKKGKTNVNF